jgi:hypothetical protein
MELLNNYEPKVWGPHYWFFLHTISYNYPETPNATTKRKYYDLIQNMPLFIPNEELGNKFSKILDKYPVSPYLDSRDSFCRWVHFIHNKINDSIGKKEKSFVSSLEKYKNNYKPKQIQFFDNIQFDQHFVYMVYILIALLTVFILYED